MKKLKLRYIILVIIFILIAISYFIPVKPESFLELYGKDDKYSRTLKEFRSRPVKYIEVNGARWKYYSGGNGDKTILFLHGMGGAYDLWWNQIVEFENNYRIVTYSLPEEINSLEGAVEGIMAILQKEKIDSVYAVGTSMGGYITQYLFYKHPAVVKKAVMGNTFPPNHYFAEKNELLTKIVPYLPEVLIAFAGELNFKKKIYPAGHNSKLLMSFLPSLPFSKKQLIGRYYVVVDYFVPDTTNPLIKKIPKLIIESDNDPLIPPHLRKRLKELYPEAKVYTFHNEGHFPYINAAEEYNTVLKKFFNETPGTNGNTE